MQKLFSNILIISLLFLTSCARDLSSDLYTSDSTMSLTLQGQVLAVRKIKIKDTDRLGDNQVGILSGAVAGGALASNSDSVPIMVGGAVLGGIVGGAIQDKLSENIGYEYIIKIDTKNLGDDYYEGSPMMKNAISSARTSGLITVVQNTKEPLREGQHAYVIISDKRARIIAKD